MIQFFLGIIKYLALAIGSIFIAINLELILLKVASRLGLRKLYDNSKTETPTEFVIFFIIIFSILISFSLVGIAFNHFKVGGRVLVLILYLLIDLNNSVVNLLGLSKNPFERKKIVYDGEDYPIFAGRLVGFVLAFVLYLLGIV